MCVQVPCPALEFGHFVERRPGWCFPKDTDHLHEKQGFFMKGKFWGAESNGNFIKTETFLCTNIKSSVFCCLYKKRQSECVQQDPHAKQRDCVWSEWTFFVILFGNQFRICFCWQFPPVVNILVHFSRTLCSWKASNLSLEYDRQSSYISSDMGDGMKKKRLHLWKQRN